MPILQLQPFHKDYVWGGTTLIEKFHMETTSDIIAESWTLSCHPDGECLDMSSKQTLTEILKQHPEYVGTKAASMDRFPIIVKLIDAKRDLSIQVHPDDVMGLALENDFGKTEVWYILDHQPDAFLYYGFKEDITKEELKTSLEQGTILEKLNKILVNKGDVFFVRAGTVHAIGAGIVIAEIQQNSNSTYRLYDYNRVGNDGKPRPLHIEKSIQAATLTKTDIPSQLHHHEAKDTVTLANCEYFTVNKLSLKDEVKIFVDKDSFMHLQIVEGGGYIIDADNKKLPYKKGDSFFISANYGEFVIRGNSEVLISTI